MHSITATRHAAHATARDEDVFQRVSKALAASGYFQLQRVQVSVHEGFVALRGCVTTYYQKQLAQEAAKRVDGVETLRNDIVVS